MTVKERRARTRTARPAVAIAQNPNTPQTGRGAPPAGRRTASRTADVDAPDDLTNGVHAVTKKIDYWFDREVGALEKQAVGWADAWAEKGLPRHDVARTEPLEPEQVLASRCAQTFRDWQLRVRTKMQDAIEKSSQQLGEHIAALRSRVARLETLGHELAEREGKIEKVRREVEAAKGEPVRYDAFVPGWVFGFCAVLLAAVEFFANFPVFRLLLPLDAALEQAAAAAAQNVNDASWWAGLQLFARGLLWNVEAGVVALVAVVVLVVLGKQVGKSARPLVVLREADHPLAARTVRAHRRQHTAAAACSLLGLACVLGFLFLSRGRIASVAASRVAQDSAAVVRAGGPQCPRRPRRPRPRGAEQRHDRRRRGRAVVGGDSLSRHLLPTVRECHAGRPHRPARRRPTRRRPRRVRPRVQHDNVLGKKTAFTRLWAWKKLRELYALAALARDALLRASVPVISGAKPGEAVTGAQSSTRLGFA